MKLWLFLRDLGAYQVVRPFDLFPGTFLVGFALVALVLIMPDSFVSWPGYTALAHDSAASGAGRFLIDSCLPVAVIYIVLIAVRWNKARCQAVVKAMQNNTVHRYPMLGAVFFIVQLPLLIFLYEARDDFVYDLTQRFWVVAYCMPWFSYLAANSFAVIVAKLASGHSSR